MTGSTVDLLAALQRCVGRIAPAPDRRTPFEVARDEHLEGIAEDRAYEAIHGGTDQDGDIAAARWENDLERQYESAQDWSERGGIR